MNLIKEKKIIREWLSKQSIDEKEWNLFFKDTDSYWLKRDNTNEIDVFDISNLQEIREELRSLWEKEEIFEDIEKVLSVAILKSCQDEIEEKVDLLDWVYIF